MNKNMEYLDVLDENGQPMGYPKTRQEIHQKGYWHRAVHIWIINSKGELLIQRRSANKETRPELWSVSCEGHIAAGYDSLNGARQKLQEQLHLDIPADKLELILTYKHSNVVHEFLIGNHFFDVYLVRMDLNIDDLHFQPEEVTALKWIPLNQYEEEMAKGNPEFSQYHEFSLLMEIYRERMDK